MSEREDSFASGDPADQSERRDWDLPPSVERPDRSAAGGRADQPERRDWDLPPAAPRPHEREPWDAPSPAETPATERTEHFPAHPSVHGETPEESERRDWEVP